MRLLWSLRAFPTIISRRLLRSWRGISDFQETFMLLEGFPDLDPSYPGWIPPGFPLCWQLQLRDGSWKAWPPFPPQIQVTIPEGNFQAPCPLRGWRKTSAQHPHPGENRDQPWIPSCFGKTWLSFDQGSLFVVGSGILDAGIFLVLREYFAFWGRISLLWGNISLFEGIFNFGGKYFTFMREYFTFWGNISLSEGIFRFLGKYFAFWGSISLLWGSISLSEGIFCSLRENFTFWGNILLLEAIF